MVPCAGILGGKYVSTDGQPQKEVGHQVNQGGSRADCGKGVIPRELSDHGNIRGVKQKLQQAGRHERQGKPEHFRKQRAGRHI